MAKTALVAMRGKERMKLQLDGTEHKDQNSCNKTDDDKVHDELLLSLLEVRFKIGLADFRGTRRPPVAQQIWVAPDSFSFVSPCVSQ